MLTAEEFVRRYHNQRADLVVGRVEKTARLFPKQGKICATISRLVDEHAEKHDLGHTMSNDSWVQTRKDPDTVRGADVCFYSYERLPRAEVPDGLLPVAPDLAVEVKSPSDRWGEIFAKVGEYLQANVRAVLVLDAVTGTASVYRAEEFQQIFHNGDELVVPEILPGFAVPVRRLFE